MNRISKELRVVEVISLLAVFLFAANLVLAPLNQIWAATKNTESVGLNQKELTLGVGRSYQLSVTGTSKAVTWKTSNSKIASVTKKGVVKGKKTGSAVISAKAGDKTYQCKVSVKEIVKQPIVIIEYDSYYEGGEKELVTFYNSWQANDIISLDYKPVQKKYATYDYNNKGIYAAFHSGAKITVEAFDSKGNSLGMATKEGSFYLEFPKATELVITNVKEDFAVYFYPIKPTIITGAGVYSYKDFTWSDMPSGNKRAYYLFSYQNSFWNLDGGTKAISKVHNTGHNLGNHVLKDAWDIPEGINDYWVCGYFSSDTKDKAADINDFSLIAGESNIYHEDKALLLYGKDGIVIPSNYIDDVKQMMKAMKKVGKVGYIKDSKVFSKRVNISVFDSHASALYPNLYLNDSFLDLSDLDNSYAHLHEMAHFYDSANFHYTFQVKAWVEGFAEVYSEDALKELGKIDQNYLHKEYDFSDFKKSGKSFEQYFLSVDTNNEEYAVGYHFLRYLQEKYGEDIIKKINASLVSKMPKPMDIYQEEATQKVFLQCIKDHTSEKVFSNFEKDVINK